MFMRPGQGDRAAAHQDHDDGLSGGCDGFEEILLGCGQDNLGAVAAGEAVDLDGHLFAFELRREADEGYNDIGLFGCGYGFIELSLRGCGPLEVESAAGLVAGVAVFQFEFVRVGVGEVDGDDDWCSTVHDGRGAGACAGGGFEVAHRGEIERLAQSSFAEDFAVQGEAEAVLGRIGEGVGWLNGEGVVAGGWDAQCAAPANGVDVGVNFRDGQRVAPLGLDVVISGSGYGAAGPVRCGEEFCFEAIAECGARDRDFGAVGEG